MTGQSVNDLVTGETFLEEGSDEGVLLSAQHPMASLVNQKNEVWGYDLHLKMGKELRFFHHEACG